MASDGGGGSGVAVGGTAVAVAGTEVAVGGTGVAVGSSSPQAMTTPSTITLARIANKPYRPIFNGEIHCSIFLISCICKSSENLYRYYEHTANRATNPESLDNDQ